MDGPFSSHGWIPELGESADQPRFADPDKAAALASDLQNNIASRAKAVVAAGSAVNVAGVSKLYQVMADLITKAHMPIAELVGESYPSVMTSIFVRSLSHLCIEV